MIRKGLIRRKTKKSTNQQIKDAWFFLLSGKGVAQSPTPWCSSYRKGSLRDTIDYGCQQN